MKALVTGANGLIGANLVRALMHEGVEVRALVRASSDVSALAGCDVELVQGELSEDVDAVTAAAKGCDWLFHTAVPFSYAREQRPSLMAAAGAGTENVLIAAKAAAVERVILTSSSVVFGYRSDGALSDESTLDVAVDADNAYVAAKIRQDALAFARAQALGLDLIAACPTICVGPFGTTLGPSNGAIVSYLQDPWHLSFPGGCNVVSTLDVAAGHVRLARSGTPGQHYLLGGENLQWRCVHALVATLAGVAPPSGELNHTLSFLAASAEEVRARLGRRAPLVTREQTNMVGRYYWYDDGKARALGYRSRSARSALALALSWLVASPHVSRELRAGLRLHDEVYAERRAHARGHEPSNRALQ